MTNPKRVIKKRDRHRCIYCKRGCKANGTLDHVIPRSKGGGETASNIVTACEQCNQEKGSKMLPPFELGRILRIVAARNRSNNISADLIIFRR
jgi:5-methylcytosine-specific restriction endonuclease McrA